MHEHITYMMVDMASFSLDIVRGSGAKERFAKKLFPHDTHACGAVTLKCRMQQYGSADEAVVDLKVIETVLGDNVVDE